MKQAIHQSHRKRGRFGSIWHLVSSTLWISAELCASQARGLFPSKLTDSKERHHSGKVPGSTAVILLMTTGPSSPDGKSGEFDLYKLFGANAIFFAPGC
jgi:hypothetical protein